MYIKAKIVKMLLVERGLYQVNVAKSLGIHPKSLTYMLKTGRGKDEIVEKLAELLNVEISEITQKTTYNYELMDNQAILHDKESGGRKMILCDPKIILSMEQRIMTQMSELITIRMNEIKMDNRLTEKTLELVSKILTNLPGQNMM